MLAIMTSPAQALEISAVKLRSALPYRDYMVGYLGGDSPPRFQTLHAQRFPLKLTPAHRRPRAAAVKPLAGLVPGKAIVIAVDLPPMLIAVRPVR